MTRGSHGGLARAGKVKKQTPIVQPQDNKKYKTGRAKKRNAFNKRLNNKGRIKGPNYQS